MVFLLNKKQNLRVIEVLTFITLISSCKEINYSEGNYKLNIVPITAITGDWSSISNVKHFTSEYSLLAEFNFKEKQLRIVNLANDEILKIIKVPENINEIGSISIYDENHLALLTDTTFYVLKNDSLYQFDHNLFKDNYYPLSYINILYDPKENTIIAGGLTYKKSTKDEKSYSSNFLLKYNLNDTTSSLLKFPYPQQFHDFNLGIPKAFLSRSYNYIIISFELDDNIYLYNLNSEFVEIIEVKSKNSFISKAYYPKNAEKKEKLDALLFNLNFAGRYGLTFYDIQEKMIYRIYYPELPEKDLNGNYYSSSDKGCYILQFNLEKNCITEYKLPNGLYFVPTFWSYNYTSNQMCYFKHLNTIKDENFCQFSLHNIYFFAD
jgi:hypothetical protein